MKNKLPVGNEYKRLCDLEVLLAKVGEYLLDGYDNRKENRWIDRAYVQMADGFIEKAYQVLYNTSEYQEYGIDTKVIKVYPGGTVTEDE